MAINNNSFSNREKEIIKEARFLSAKDTDKKIEEFLIPLMEKKEKKLKEDLINFFNKLFDEKLDLLKKELKKETKEYLDGRLGTHKKELINDYKKYLRASDMYFYKD